MANLIVYFSRKGQNWSNGRVVKLEKGNTELAAEIVRNAVGGELFEIAPVDDYPDDYKATSERARAEYDAAARPALKRFLGSIGVYDTLFVLYPNWFGTMPMPVFTFLEHYDLKGKRIAPLCTNEGSGVGESVRDIERVAKGAVVTEGLSVHGSGVKQSEKFITAWAQNVVKG